MITLLATLALAACTDAPAPAVDAGAATAQERAPHIPRDVEAGKRQAHAALARRLRPFLIERVPARAADSAMDLADRIGARMAADDERLRLGAFWKARSDTHHFNADFRVRAGAVLALPGDSTAAADAALRQLLGTVDRRLPAWQALVDYNASGRMREDGGDGGRALLPGCIAAIDAIEGAVWTYVSAADAATAPRDPPR